jgi:hypothetical protein
LQEKETIRLQLDSKKDTTMTEEEDVGKGRTVVRLVIGETANEEVEIDDAHV